MNSDLIAAIATPTGTGGVGIVRLSGSAIETILPLLTLRCLPPPRMATRSRFIDENGEIIDEGLVLYFPAPHSFTGEDVVELHAHGGVFVMQRLLSRCLQLGARLATAGEFTLRAYLNNKLDLAQAEALADLINAASTAAAGAAARSLTGTFSQAVTTFTAQLRQVRIAIESDLDFNDEDSNAIDTLGSRQRLQTLLQQLEQLLQQTRQGARLTSGVDAVIIGAPNVGKSSLLNCLADEDAAIVSAEAGTTRDLIERQIIVEGLAMRVTDTAGLRSGSGVSEIEEEGIRRARQRLHAADVVICIATADTPPPTLPSSPALTATVLSVHNKIDQSGEAAGARDGIHYLSAKTTVGVDDFRAALCLAAGHAPEASAFSARTRHVAALQAAHSRLQEAIAASLPELAAAWLREADTYLQTITGGYDEEDLLGDIFSTFCIGK